MYTNPLATSGLTEAESAALGGFLGGYLASVGVFALIVYILLIIAWWKIFEKAGEAGWKSLIPIYNVYILCKIIGVNFWIYVLLIPFCLGVIGGLVPFLAFLEGIYALFLEIWLAIKLGRAFKKGTLFKLGLIFLAPIFYLILGFGLSKYHGKK